MAYFFGATQYSREPDMLITLMPRKSGRGTYFWERRAQSFNK